MIRRLNRLMYQKTTPRRQAGVTRFFDGLDMVEPGVVRVQEWRPDTETAAKSPPNMWGGGARQRRPAPGPTLLRAPPGRRAWVRPSAGRQARYAAPPPAAGPSASRAR